MSRIIIITPPPPGGDPDPGMVNRASRNDFAQTDIDAQAAHDFIDEAFANGHRIRVIDTEA